MNNYKNYQRPQQTYKRQQGGFKRPQRQQTQQQHKPTPEAFINFCKKKCASISDELKNYVHHQLTQQYYFEHKPTMPMKTANDLPNPAYLITINKKNKFNFLLFLTRFQNKNYSIFVYNHKGQLHYYSVKFGFNQELYNGTLFRGELVKNQKDCWIYYLTDLVYYKGQYKYESKLSQKLKMMAGLLKNEYEYDDYMNVCHIQIKGYFTFNHLQFIKKDCQLLFVPEYFNDHIYSCDIILPKKVEIKIENNQEQDFIIRKTDTHDVYDLYNIKTKTFDSIACVNKSSTSMFLKERFENVNEFVVKTKYSVYFKSWIPLN